MSIEKRKLRMSEKSRDNFYMEDVHGLALEAMEVIEKGLREYGIELKPGQDDEFYMPMVETIEKYSNGYYRHDH